ncbi:hypothetical protein ACP4OV_030222 [Aristida adscensionis]
MEGSWFRRKEGSCSNVVSFLLGAGLPTALLLVLASDRLGDGLSKISVGWQGNATILPPGFSLPLDGNNQNQEEQDGFRGLAELLPRVAMEDRTVIVTMVNEAWVQPNSLLDLYRGSFKNGEDIAHLLDHLLVIAVDAGGFDGCKAVHPHCYLLQVNPTNNLTSAKRFMTKGFVELVWLKLTFQQRILELGYNFFFTDADMIWFRDPFRHITVYADMAISTDGFTAASAMDNTLNTGLYYMKSTSRSIEAIKYWREARARFPGENEQGVFNQIKYELVRKLQARIEPLHTLYFTGFCELHDNLHEACTMHANCCIGLETKVHDLSDIAADWKNYTSLTPEERNKGGFKWTPPVKCWNTMGRH